jgi:hypothetical protein
VQNPSWIKVPQLVPIDCQFTKAVMRESHVALIERDELARQTIAVPKLEDCRFR